MARIWRGRRSRREEITAFNAAHSFYAAASDSPDAQQKLATIVQPVPPKRDRIRRPVDGKPVVYEKHVLASALDALRHDQRVWLVDRRQSGVFQEGERYIRVGTPGVLDISGMLKGGIYFELEAKRPGEKPDARQLRRIEHVRTGGGISGWFTSVEEALALLP